MGNQQIQRMLAGFHTGGTLNGMNTAYQVECINNQQMDGHRCSP